MKPPRVWITGAGGLIGNQLLQRASRDVSGWEVTGLGRGDLDLEDGPAVERRWRTGAPDLVIHCAGLTRSPACQADPDRARRANVQVTERLARLASASGSRLVFLSTDLVFDGARGRYRESDAPNPLSVYAETKAEAERRVLEADPAHVVIRTSLNHGASPTGDRSFTEDMLRTVRAGGRLALFTDEFRCPIPAAATARAIWSLARGLRAAGVGAGPSGIFHVAGAERLSRWEIGRILAAVYPEFEGRLDATSLRAYRGAPRSPDTSLDCGRVRDWLDFPLPRFSEWIRSAGREIA